jgi:phosphoenolpyruvate synthase/pyruvate phosphate dikinase
MDKNMLEQLKISEKKLGEVNSMLMNPSNTLVGKFFEVVNKYGTVDEINKKADEARKLENLSKRLKSIDSPYLKDIEWLLDQKEKKAFVNMEEFERGILGDKYGKVEFDKKFAVTLEISALQFFPWLIKEAKRAIKKGI